MGNLQFDAVGAAHFVDRLGKEMDPIQFYREAFQNGAEGGATKVRFDGWTDPLSGQVCARCSDNGLGMTNDQLVDHLGTLFTQNKGEEKGNYGVGARVASLPYNKAGVTFASRTFDDEGLIKIVKKAGVYQLQEWDGYEVTDPTKGELDKIGPGTGTTVILHGNGKKATWNSSEAYKVQKFLAERYYLFPEGVDVTVNDGKDTKAVHPFGQFLADYKTADGEVGFRNVDGMAGIMFWWVLPPYSERHKARANLQNGGVGVVVDDEIFQYDMTHSGDFGLVYKSVASRVAVLVWVDGATMTTGRNAVSLPRKSRNKTVVPWGPIGLAFMEQMPAEIQALLDEVDVSTVKLDRKIADDLNEDWRKMLEPVKVLKSAKTGDPGAGAEDGETLPPGDDTRGNDGTVNPDPKPRLAAEQTAGGDLPVKESKDVVLPETKWCTPDEMNESQYVTWVKNANLVKVSLEYQPYLGFLREWTAKYPKPMTPIVVMAVQQAMGVEFAATVVHALGQKKYVDPDLLLTDEALYTKGLGMLAINEMVKVQLKHAKKIIDD